MQYDHVADEETPYLKPLRQKSKSNLNAQSYSSRKTVRRQSVRSPSPRNPRRSCSRSDRRGNSRRDRYSRRGNTSRRRETSGSRDIAALRGRRDSRSRSARSGSPSQLQQPQQNQCHLDLSPASSHRSPSPPHGRMEVDPVEEQEDLHTAHSPLDPEMTLPETELNELPPTVQQRLNRPPPRPPRQSTLASINSHLQSISVPASISSAPQTDKDRTPVDTGESPWTPNRGDPPDGASKTAFTSTDSYQIALMKKIRQRLLIQKEAQTTAKAKLISEGLQPSPIATLAPVPNPVPVGIKIKGAAQTRSVQLSGLQEERAQSSSSQINPPVNRNDQGDGGETPYIDTTAIEAKLRSQALLRVKLAREKSKLAETNLVSVSVPSDTGRLSLEQSLRAKLLSRKTAEPTRS